MRKRPGVASVSADASTSAKRPAATSVTGSGGLLASILGDVRRSAAERAVASRLGKRVDREDVLDRETKALEARRAFERATRERLEREVVGSSNPSAFCEFEGLEKQWRNVVHEIAAEMRLFSESVEVGDGDEKFVIVSKTDPADGREEGRADASARGVGGAKQGLKKGEALSDKAPTFAGDNVELTVVGTVKRDLRSVEETIADMRKAKEARGGGGGDD